LELTITSLTFGGTGLFALWALYVSLVEHPARMSAGAAAGVAQFRESYRRAAPWQAGAAALAFASGVLASLLTSVWAWALGGVLVGLAIPFTLVIILPTNRRLLYSTPSESEAATLLALWGRLHWVRTLLGLMALVILCSRVRLV
jgi:anthrone oxygenase-like protein